MNRLDRRTLLKGAGSVLIGLPLLEVMQPRTAYGAPPPSVPRRFICSFAGTLHGSTRDLNPPVGALSATLPAGLASLAPVRQHVSMISGLTVPIYQGTQSPSPGSAYNMNHGGVLAPMFAGVHSKEIMAIMAGGHTVDQVVADAIGGGTRLKSVQARIQAAGYGGGPAKGIASARLDGGTLRALPPISSPALLFSTLFGSPVPTGNPGAVASNKDRSVLDYVLQDAARISSTVSASDRVRLDQHFSEIRELEQRIQTVPKPTATCTSPVAPGTDPALGNPGTFGGWSNETLRGDVMADMIALALSCDLTRAVSLMVSYDQSFLRTQDSLANYPDMHAVGHSATSAQIFANTNWTVGRFAKVVERLAAMPEAGGTVLDTTFVVLAFAEGSNSHNKSNINWLVAGVPSKIKAGQHIASGGAHPATVMISGMNAIGINRNTLGEISGTFAPMMV